MNAPRRIGLALAVSSVCPAFAQDPGSLQTRDFVQAASESDTFEILEAQTVLGQSTDTAVRGFAEQMIRDHRQMRLALIDAATRGGIKPPAEGMSSDQSQMLGALQGMRGPDFDKAYLRQQALAHASALVTVQNYAAGGDAPDLRQVATNAIPVIAAHRAMAQQMQAARDGT